DVLDAGASEVVVGEIAIRRQHRELLLSDRAGVPDDRRVEGAVGVEADALWVDAHPGKELGPFGDRERDLTRDRRLRDANWLVRITDPLRMDGVADGLARDIEEGPEALLQLLLRDKPEGGR